ncbi:MAG: CsbD family protein [Phycisphaera sp. RhM]|nr:CsbD family protein [Phycisphaera sp. RhM]
MVTRQQASGQWNQIHGAVQKKYGQVTDDELREVEGDSERLIGLIQKKAGVAREEVESFVRKVYQDCGETCSNLTERAGEYAQATRDQLRQGYEGTTKAVAKHPLESVVTALGVGLLAGIAIGYSLAADRYRQPTWRERFSGR